MKVPVIVALSFVLLMGCAKAQQPPEGQQPQPQQQQNQQVKPAEVGDDVPNTNGQMKYEKVLVLSKIEQSAVEGFNTKAAILQQQMSALQAQGKDLISELKDDHKVDGQWLVSPDGKSLVLVKQKTPAAPPVGAPKADKPAPAPSAKPKQKSEVKSKSTGNVSQTSTGPNSPNINGADNVTVKPD